MPCHGTELYIKLFRITFFCAQLQQLVNKVAKFEGSLLFEAAPASYSRRKTISKHEILIKLPIKLATRDLSV
jgi:hypothetical protein